MLLKITGYRRSVPWFHSKTRIFRPSSSGFPACFLKILKGLLSWLRVRIDTTFGHSCFGLEVIVFIVDAVLFGPNLVSTCMAVESIEEDLLHPLAIDFDAEDLRSYTSKDTTANPSANADCGLSQRFLPVLQRKLGLKPVMGSTRGPPVGSQHQILVGREHNQELGVTGSSKVQNRFSRMQ